jgi:hypothetical protein
MMKMKPPTQTVKVLAKMMTTAEAAAAATPKKPLNMKKIPRRLILPADIAETLALCGDLYEHVNSMGRAIFSEQLVL